MIKQNIPNFLTLCNVLCGCVAIVFAFEENLVYSAYLVGIACLFDFLDGMAARLLNVKSEIGKQLDSLADMVSFGVLPGVMMFKMISLADPIHPFETPHSNTYSGMIGFLIVIFSAIRLAKFNIDARQTDSFIGVPTPAATIFIASLPLIVNFHSIHEAYISSEALYYSLITTTFVFSFLLVAPLPLIALKFTNFSFADNKIRYIFLLLSVLLLLFFKFVGVPIIIILYLIVSIINNLLIKKIK